MSTERNSDKPLVTLDLCGLNCPAPLLGAKHVIDDLRPGEVMQLISDCPGTPDDLFAWSRHTGNEVIATDKLGGLRVAYTMKAGEVLLLVSNCPGSPDDVNSWVRATGLELIAKQEMAPGTYEFFIRKTPGRAAA